MNGVRQEYCSSYTYDANGNLEKLVRHGHDNGGPPTTMDSLTYSYPSSGTNQLDRVADAVTGDPYAEDLASQPTGWYQYDAVGNLVAEGATTIAWDSYGRVKTVAVGGVNGATIRYQYDAAGNRVKNSRSAHRLGDNADTGRNTSV